MKNTALHLVPVKNLFNRFAQTSITTPFPFPANSQATISWSGEKQTVPPANVLLCLKSKAAQHRLPHRKKNISAG
jgi:hypothetical protein